MSAVSRCRPQITTPAESRALCLKDNQIADAALIEPSAVVDHQYVAGCSPFESLQEDVDATGVSGWKRAPGEVAPGHDRAQRRWRAAHLELSADACIRQMGGRKGVKPSPKPFVLVSHSQGPLTSRGRACRTCRLMPQTLDVSTTAVLNDPAPSMKQGKRRRAHERQGESDVDDAGTTRFAKQRRDQPARD